MSYDTAAPRRDIKTNTVWVWLMVFLPVLNLLGIVIFDWSSYFRDSFYAGVYSYDSGSASMAGTNAATALITVVTSVVSIVVSALTVLFAFLDWRQLRARGVDRPFHWAFSFFVLVVGSGLVYIIGRGVILRRRTGSGLAPIWASIAVNLAVVVGFHRLDRRAGVAADNSHQRVLQQLRVLTRRGCGRSRRRRPLRPRR